MGRPWEHQMERKRPVGPNDSLVLRAGEEGGSWKCISLSFGPEAPSFSFVLFQGTGVALKAAGSSRGREEALTCAGPEFAKEDRWLAPQ